MNLYLYGENNSIGSIDVTGTSAVAAMVVAGVCGTYAAVSTFINLLELADLADEVNDIRDQVEKMESYCPLGERPQFYQDHINKLRKEMIKATKKYTDAKGATVVSAIAKLTVCGAAVGIAAAIPAP